jgi:Icc-related predicted phosphoesterase
MKTFQVSLASGKRLRINAPNYKSLAVFLEESGLFMSLGKMPRTKTLIADDQADLVLLGGDAKSKSVMAKVAKWTGKRPDLAKAEAAKELDEAVQEAIDKAQSIRDAIDEIDRPDSEFLTDVAESCESMQQTMSEMNVVTTKQSNALRSWERAIEKWRR